MIRRKLEHGDEIACLIIEASEVMVFPLGLQVFIRVDESQGIAQNRPPQSESLTKFLGLKCNGAELH
jgi:hypothetical protein